MESSGLSKDQVAKAEKLLENWIAFLLNCDSLNLNAKFESMLNIYLVLGNSTSLKASLFIRMVEFLVEKK